MLLSAKSIFKYYCIFLVFLLGVCERIVSMFAVCRVYEDLLQQHDTLSDYMQ